MNRHYVLCQHGLFGNRVDFQRFAEYFQERPDENVEVIILSKNERMHQTLDGVAVAGERCWADVVLAVAEMDRGSSISVLGHSMGGLLLRYALRKIELHQPSFWQDAGLKPRLAIFVATPHLGIGSSNWLIRTSSQYIFRHLFRSVSDLSLSTQVLKELADDAGVAALNRFDQVVLFSNASGDTLVSARSALMLEHVIIPENNLAGDVMTVIEYSVEPINQADAQVQPEQFQIVEMLKSLKNVQRFLVTAPCSLPGALKLFDNSAHTKIICHGLLDRSRVGMPMINHMGSLICKPL